DGHLGEGEEPSVPPPDHRPPLPLELGERELVDGAECGIEAAHASPLLQERGEGRLAAGAGEVADGAGGEQVSEPRPRFAPRPAEGERIERGCFPPEEGEANLPTGALVPPAGDPRRVSLVEPARNR